MRETHLEIIRAACVKANPEKKDERDHVNFPCQDICTNGRDTYHDWNEQHGGGCAIGNEAAPLRLADVLLAIWKQAPANKTLITLESDGQFIVTSYDNAGKKICSGPSWKLSEDDLTAQSDETLEFLASLLGNKG